MITRPRQEIIEMEVAEQEALLSRLEQAGAQPADVQRIRAVFDSYAYVADLVEQKRMSVARLRQILFGARTEKTAQVLGRDEPTASVVAQETSATDSAVPAPTSAPAAPPKPTRPGHGRNGAADFPGAERIAVAVPALFAGSPCPECVQGTVYELATPGALIRLVGQAPIRARIYELQKLRCNLCAKIFTAPTPEDAQGNKYDPNVGSLIALLKYGGGVPFHRLERLQQNLGVPLPASTQWEIVDALSTCVLPAYEELIRQAAQGDVLYNDDTTVRILERMGQKSPPPAAPAAADATADAEDALDPQRTGLFTSGVVATTQGRRIALFFSGRQHAGENLADVLKHRAAELPPPIQMCDALSRNVPRAYQTILANCLAHGRRKFVELLPKFKDECAVVLESIGTVYKYDEQARQEGLTPDERLKLHQTHSGPVMERLNEWLKQQIDERLVEPNSGLGAAIEYLRKHWQQLTQFLRVAGAPLDSNVVERAPKKAILHRKNAMFFKTQHGADVGDRLMSLIYTCELCGTNAFEYLTELQQHQAEVLIDPSRWLPWNYREPRGPD